MTPGPSLVTRSGPRTASVAPDPHGMRIGHFVGITSPRRAVLLAVVICVLALSLAVPFRNYVGQRGQLADVHEQQRILADKVAELQRRRDLLADPQQVEAQARERLRYVRPGEAPYVVQLPPGQTVADPPGTSVAVLPPPRPLWYAELWKSINSG